MTADAWQRKSVPQGIVGFGFLVRRGPRCRRVSRIVILVETRWNPRDGEGRAALDIGGPDRFRERNRRCHAHTIRAARGGGGRQPRSRWSWRAAGWSAGLARWRACVVPREELHVGTGDGGLRAGAVDVSGGFLRSARHGGPGEGGGECHPVSRHPDRRAVAGPGIRGAGMAGAAAGRGGIQRHAGAGRQTRKTAGRRPRPVMVEPPDGWWRRSAGGAALEARPDGPGRGDFLQRRDSGRSRRAGAGPARRVLLGNDHPRGDAVHSGNGHPLSISPVVRMVAGRRAGRVGHRRLALAAGPRDAARARASGGGSC